MKHRKKQRNTRKPPKASEKHRAHRATGRPRGRPTKYRIGERHGHHRYYTKQGVFRRRHFKRIWQY